MGEIKKVSSSREGRIILIIGYMVIISILAFLLVFSIRQLSAPGLSPGEEGAISHQWFWIFAVMILIISIIIMIFLIAGIMPLKKTVEVQSTISEVKGFAIEARKRGYEDKEIHDMLSKSGWTDSEIYSILED